VGGGGGGGWEWGGGGWGTVELKKMLLQFGLDDSMEALLVENGVRCLADVLVRIHTPHTYHITYTHHIHTSMYVCGVCM